jgi:hypothetical protein
MAANPQYQVLYPEAVRQVVRELLQRATERGIQPRVAAAIGTIDGRLRSDPLVYGDVHNHLQRWTRLVRVQSPLFVRYAVSTFQHEGRFLVVVSAIEPLTGHGLEPARGEQPGP